jgi:hypothetical protein
MFFTFNGLVIFLYKVNNFLSGIDRMYSHRDQKKFLEALKKYERKFNRQECEEYKTFIKRDKDEEEFDTVSMKRLKELYDKYYEPPDISKYDKFFKKRPDNETEK